MSLVVIPTPGDANANSYLTVQEAQDYFDARLPISQWVDADSQELLIVMATRVFDALFSPRRLLVRDAQSGFYYRTFPTWTGSPASTTQSLSWPRSGMYTRNGGIILSTVIPLEIKDAVAELAGQLAIGDRTLDNDVIAQGITSIKAGSVSLSFKNDFEFNTIPGIVRGLLVPSWLTDELVEYAFRPEFSLL